MQATQHYRYIGIDQFLAYFSFVKYDDGSVGAKHNISGSGIRFFPNGDVKVTAAQDIYLEPQRYLFHGPDGDPASADEVNKLRALAGHAAVIEAIAKGNLGHLRPWAEEQGIIPLS